MIIRRLRLARCFPSACAVTLCAFAGCASSTVLQTQPPGARVSINGAVVGNTPYTLTDTKIVGSSTPIHFEYPGYAPLDVTISRSEEVDVLPLIAGIFVLIPLLWVMKYQSTHLYQLQPPGPGYAPAPNGWAPPAQGYPPPPAGPAGYPPPPPGYPPPAQ
ncbi:MAG TPA: PEGA domain-containing protein [Polyangia bacterium]|nr:PEGA domain-containing protein [Polyangia bacterium]